MRSNPDDLDVFASEEVTELFGWPVTLLDEIRKLDVLARRGEVDIWEWRRRDQELRALGPTRYPRDRIKATYDAALDECCVRKRGGGEGLDRMGRLAARLAAALRGAPDDDQLHRELAEIDLLSAERHRGLEAGLEHDRELIVWWLATSVRLDYQTGLPWDYLARYRWISDPVLGLVPALINVARARAFAEAPDDIAQLARRLRPDAKPDPFAEAELSQHALTWFPRCLIEAARRGDQDAAAVVEQVRRLWEAPQTRRFLLNATARGWPEHLRESAPVTPR